MTRKKLVKIFCYWMLLLPDLVRGMGARRKTMEPYKPGNFPGLRPEEAEMQRKALRPGKNLPISEDKGLEKEKRK